ncbi:hypothetical protein [Bradyrhizobium sp. 2S1]|uniref:hypothetical protein n=1 Tax=Bradyrhizobium sp. 2S1 TaxID=1404429 RepID=UPI0014094E87|nr:hypothetical protein [Bradyrhizobium sp. 2S1]MCK7672940.1 hypothetical protein [Bradyrhizobium sp. 2S1]
MIDSKQASAALADINDVVQRVRQSRIYQIASIIITLWGVLLFVAYIANHLWPRQGYTIWTVTNLSGLAISTAVGFVINLRSGNRTFPIRSTISFLLISVFGVYCSVMLGHFGPRQMIVFWVLYGMLFYAIAGVWFGYAFIVIAACTSALTLIGYYYIGPAFLLWMAVVHGGGLMLGGLWMRRI